VLHLKNLRGQCVGERVTAWGELGSEGKQRGEILRLAMLAQDEHASPHAQLEGPPGGGAWFAGHGRIVPTYNPL